MAWKIPVSGHDHLLKLDPLCIFVSHCRERICHSRRSKTLTVQSGARLRGNRDFKPRNFTVLVLAGSICGLLQWQSKVSAYMRSEANQQVAGSCAGACARGFPIPACRQRHECLGSCSPGRPQRVKLKTLFQVSLFFCVQDLKSCIFAEHLPSGLWRRVSWSHASLRLEPGFSDQNRLWRLLLLWIKHG